MIDRRGVLALPLFAVAPAAAAPANAPRNCGDPGGRFIACEAVQRDLPPPAWTRCPLCGGRHATLPAR